LRRAWCGEWRGADRDFARPVVVATSRGRGTDHRHVID
jgi:hypothetical protein